MSATDTRAKECRHLIGGKWVDSAGGGSFDDLDPYTGDVVASVASGGREDARRAIEAAETAFAEWSQAGPGQRQAVFLKAADILESRRDEVVEMAGQGDRLQLRLRHVPDGLRARPLPPGGRGRIRAARPGAPVRPARRVRDGRPPPGRRRRRDLAVERGADPVGSRDRRPDRLRQHRRPVKPSEESPYVGGLLWGEIFAEAGLPDGVLNIVTHDRAGAPGRSATSSSRTRACAGSTSPARRPPAASWPRLPGGNLKRVVLELGGQNPLIVLADADLEYAVNAAAFGAYLHQGQICMSARRIIVERPIAEEFTAALAEKVAGLGVGDPREHDHDHRPADQPGRARDRQPPCRRGR